MEKVTNASFLCWKKGGRGLFLCWKNGRIMIARKLDTMFLHRMAIDDIGEYIPDISALQKHTEK